jgi:hypothetical protein
VKSSAETVTAFSREAKVFTPPEERWDRLICLHGLAVTGVARGSSRRLNERAFEAPSLMCWLCIL